MSISLVYPIRCNATLALVFSSSEKLAFSSHAIDLLAIKRYNITFFLFLDESSSCCKMFHCFFVALSSLRDRPFLEPEQRQLSDLSQVTNMEQVRHLQMAC